MTLRQTAKNFAAALEETGQARFGTRSIEWAADILEPLLSELIQKEREACAVVAENYSQVEGGPRVVALNIAHMIRSRDQ